MFSLLEPLSFSYMWYAIVASALIGGVCAFLSSYLILKGWSLMGDALAHSIIPGVALAYIFSIPYVFGAFASSLLSSFSMNFIKEKTKLREDTIMGLVFTSFFAFGLVLVSIKPTSINLKGIIFGDILAISNKDLVQIFIVSTISIIVLLLKWRDFLILFFDENGAITNGLSIRFLKVLFFTILSIMAATALQVVGVCLVIAMLVTPGAIASFLTKKFSHLIIFSFIFGVVTSVLGTYLSYFFNASTGGIIVSLQSLIFILVFIFAPNRGFLSQKKLLLKT